MKGNTKIQAMRRLFLKTDFPINSIYNDSPFYLDHFTSSQEMRRLSENNFPLKKKKQSGLIYV